MHDIQQSKERCCNPLHVKKYLLFLRPSKIPSSLYFWKQKRTTKSIISKRKTEGIKSPYFGFSNFPKLRCQIKQYHWLYCLKMKSGRLNRLLKPGRSIALVQFQLQMVESRMFFATAWKVRRETTPLLVIKPSTSRHCQTAKLYFSSQQSWFTSSRGQKL